MTRFDSLADFGDELNRLGRDLTTTDKRKITAAMAVKAQRIHEIAASADLGGDPKFSGWAPRLETKVRPISDGASLISPKQFSAGPWTVAEFGRNSTAGPRMVGFRLTKTGRVSRARRKRWNGTTEGKETATDALRAMERELPPIAEQGVKRAIRRRFD